MTKKSFIALTLTLLLLVSLLIVPAYADGQPTTCDHVCTAETCKVICGEDEHTHDEGCYEKDPATGEVKLTETRTCGKTYHVHSDVGGDCYELTCTHPNNRNHTPECYTFSCDKEEHKHTADCKEMLPTLTCQEPEHTHTADCFRCKHVHDVTCGVYYADPDLNTKTEAPVVVEEEATSPKTGEVISISALVALMAAAVVCVVLSARKVRG